jgi:hypothetical protein
MNQFGLIDDKTYRATRMTPQEAQAVIEMWTLQTRMNDEGAGMTSIDDVAEGLTISPEQVRQYLKQHRRAKKTIRPPRNKSTDIKLALAAMATLVIVAATIAGVINNQRSQNWSQNYYSAPTGRILQNGVVANEFRFSLPHDWANRYTSYPLRHAIAIGATAFSIPPATLRTGTAQELRSAIRLCVGGALADGSVVNTKTVGKAEIDEALKADPANSPQFDGPGSGSYDYDRSMGRADGQGLIDWQTIQLAYGGKVVRGTMPYAKVSDPGLREAVLKAQNERIAKLADAGIDLASIK